MRKCLAQFWRNENGYLVAMEWVFVASILTLGTIAGMLLSMQHAEGANLRNPPALTR